MPNGRNYILKSELETLNLRDPAFRYKLKSGKTRTKNQIPLPGQSLYDQYPIISRQFLHMLDDNMTNLQPQDLRPQDHHRAAWICQTCGVEFTSSINRVVDHGESTCQACKQKRYMKNLKEHNDRIREENREQEQLERRQRKEHKKT